MWLTDLFKTKKRVNETKKISNSFKRRDTSINKLREVKTPEGDHYRPSTYNPMDF